MEQQKATTMSKCSECSEIKLGTTCEKCKKQHCENCSCESDFEVLEEEINLNTHYNFNIQFNWILYVFIMGIVIFVFSLVTAYLIEENRHYKVVIFELNDQLKTIYSPNGLLEYFSDLKKTIIETKKSRIPFFN